MYPSAIPFVLVHLACIAALWTGFTWLSVATCAVLYWLRIFAIGAGYHRYFSHRAYSTSRAFQFAIALLAQSTAQKSVLWWAAKHRHHHLHSDTERDVHSPRHKGFIYSHLGWIFARRHDATDLVKIADFARYPELMWLHRYEVMPAVGLGVLCFLIGGWSGLVVGFFWSTVLVYHATFSINSLAHVCGKKRYVTADNSRNNWLLAAFTMGEGWHNNHHAFQSSVRQGFGGGTIVLAASIGNCPKPVPHHRHKPVPAMQCTCIDEPPRTMWLTPPEPDVEPIPLSVYPYYIPMTWDNSPDESYPPGDDFVGYLGPIGGYRSSVIPMKTPEIDSGSFAAFATMLGCALAVIRGRR